MAAADLEPSRQGGTPPRSRLTPKQAAGIGGVLVAFIIGGAALERAPDLIPARDSLRTEEGPAGTRSSKVGRILEQIGIETDGETFGWVTPEEAPSTLAIDPEQAAAAPLVLSLVADVDDLADPETGIQANATERGREWERVSFVSYFRDGELVHASRVGLRHHGGVARSDTRRSSWRLYFRDEYASVSGHRLLFEADPGALSRVVVRRAPPRMPNLMALEIARHNGALTPAAAPARLFLNGVDQGNYVVSEHVNPDGWGRTYFGHQDFVMYVYKGLRSSTGRSIEAYERVAEWAAAAPAPLTMDAVGERIDVDNLVRHMFTFFFAGTTDWAQGAAVRDDSHAAARWRFVHWDLDQSFRDDWALPGIEGTLNGGRSDTRGDVRALVLRRLLAEDPAFVAYFVELCGALLDNTDASFLAGLLQRYEHLLRPSQVAELSEFFAHRPAVIRDELGRLSSGAAPATR